MVVASLVEPARCASLKKHLSIPEEDEYQCSSGPLNDFVLWSVLSAMPFQAGLSKRKSRPLKQGYVADLVREGGVSPCGVLLGLIYIQRLAKTNPSYMATLSPRQLFLIAMVVASKYLNDEGEMEALTNSEWAAIGAIPKPNLDNLERDFLKAIDWKLYVPLDEFYAFVGSVEGRVALEQAMRRGWLSYTDLVAIWNTSDTYTSMLQYTTKVAFTGATLYLVCVSTLLAATHSFCLDSATPSGPVFSTLSSSSSLPGHPVDNVSAPVWPHFSALPMNSSARRHPDSGKSLLNDTKLLLHPVSFLDTQALTHSLVQPDISQESLLQQYCSLCCNGSCWFSRSVKSSISRPMCTNCSQHYQSHLRTRWRHAQLQEIPLMDKLDKLELNKFKNHSHNFFNLAPGIKYKCDDRGQSPISLSPHGSISKVTVQVPQALELGYSHKGTFHWDLLVNTSSWSEHRNDLSGTFTLLAQYLISS